MDHDEKQDSMATVNIKESSYAPSETYTSEPPPAYQKPKSSAVQIARIAALTVVACSVILGSFILAAAWITSTSSCQYVQTIQDGIDNPSFQQLVDPLQSDESKVHRKETVVPAPDEDSNEVHTSPIQFKLPLTLDFDELAGTLMEKNQRARMNCVVEKRRSDEVVDHQPKTVRLPFGVNITTDPRLEHISGEKMMIFCESGNDQRHVPMETMPPPMVVHHMPPPQSAAPELPNLQLLHHILQQHQQQQQQQEIPTVIHTTIHVGEEHPVPMEGRQGRAFHHPVPLPVQVVEERSERMEGRQGRAFLRPVQIPFHVAEESRRGRAFPQPIVLPFQVAEERIETGRQGRSFPGVQITEARVYQHPMEAAEGRAFPRLPVHAPAPLHAEQPRPHYVQPRSVRSVDEVLHRREKRMRRCACNCDC